MCRISIVNFFSIELDTVFFRGWYPSIAKSCCIMTIMNSLRVGFILYSPLVPHCSFTESSLHREWKTATLPNPQLQTWAEGHIWHLVWTARPAALDRPNLLADSSNAFLADLFATLCPICKDSLHNSEIHILRLSIWMILRCGHYWFSRFEVSSFLISVFYQ